MSGPFANVTVLNAPNCNLPYPGGSSALCFGNGTAGSADACASACAVNASCTGYTWHDSGQGQWALQCVFRVDGAWQPETGAIGHSSGQKIVPPSLTWPVTDGFDRLPVMWFGANTSGLDNDETLALIARHRVGGYGWQQGTGTLDPAHNLGRGETHLLEAGQHLTDFLAGGGGAGTNGTLVFVYRQIQVALRLFEAARAAADDPADSDLWIHDVSTGALCQANQPWGTADPFWNFTNPAAVAYWLDNVVGELTSEAGAVGAVFFDETDQGFCGMWNTPQGGCAPLPQSQLAPMQAANNAMLGQMVATLNAAGIIPLLSSINRFTASGGDMPCVLPEDATAAALSGLVYARFYENWPDSYWTAGGPELEAAMIANAILEGAAGIPLLIHSYGGACPDPGRPIPRPGRVGGPFEYPLAAFLIAQTPGNVFSVSPNWYDSDFCWHPEFDVAYGQPLAAAVRTSTYTWTRNFTQCNVAINVSSHTAEVWLV